MEKILIIANDLTLRRELGKALRSWSYVPIEAANVATALQLFGNEHPAFILVDIDLSGHKPVNDLRKIRSLHPDAPIFGINNGISQEAKMSAQNAGVSEFISLPINLEEIKNNIAKDTSKESTSFTKNGYRFDQIIGESPEMKEMISLASKVAASDIASVLLQGESGTGKDLVAKAIHYASPRTEKPFVAINCAAIPENLLESELFGYEKGAFTDAKIRKQGLFEQVAGGTIFLDEIGELDISLQAKLLRVLEENSFRRVGGLKDIAFDARIISASNKNLKDECDRRNFRPDLFYRLSVIQINIPPLRERDDDILLLANYFIRSLDTTRHRSKPRRLAPEVVKAFSRHNWSGNIRELRNVIEGALIIEEGEQITLKSLPPMFSEQYSYASNSSDNGAAAHHIQLPPTGISLEAVENSLIEQALRRSKGNITRAGELLNISRDQMRYRLKKKRLEQELNSLKE